VGALEVVVVHPRAASARPVKEPREAVALGVGNLIVLLVSRDFDAWAVKLGSAGVPADVKARTGQQIVHDPHDSV
jgi:hypothetical protein